MEDVTIDINADISGYSSSLTQAIATAENFSKASDNLVGRLNKLNSVTLSMIKNTTAFTGANKLGVAQAAAYQQKLAGIETTARVTGKSFDALERTTKRFAREFPIGIEGAVEVMTALSHSGVTTNKEMQKLGKTFIEVGAAAGEFGPQIGSDLLQLSRTFGKGTNDLQKYADSLISVTKKYGASASSVLSFSKAIAPVASTVGMSETSVMGLSTAMSRLGEDGYRAANAFNKILLDMSKSIRTGSPEIREYAAVMGMTTESLQSLMKTNPTDVIVKFTESIKSQGTDAIRVLDDLGLEGVSTFKAISALSREGNLGEIIDEASKSFGNDATFKGAETALTGINDQMQRLQESMSQTVASSGKPFLGYLTQVLDVANDAADGIARIAETEPVQKAGTVLAPVTAGIHAMSTAIGTASLFALGKTMLKGAWNSGIGNEFRNGVERGAAGMQVAGGPGAAGMAARFGGFIGGIRGPNIVDAPSAFSAAARGVMTGGRIATNLAALNYRSMASIIDRSTGGAGFTTAAGVNASDAFRQVGKDMGALKTAVASGDLKAIAAAEANLAASAKAAAAASREFALANRGATQATGNLTKAFLQASGAITKFAMSTLVKGGSVLASLGLTGPMGFIVAGAVVGMGLKKATDEGNELAKASVSVSGYDAFNQFAEKAGLATRTLNDFAASVKEATMSLAAENTTRQDAFDISQAEINNATQAGYVPSYEIKQSESEDNTQVWTKNIALAGRGMLGKNPASEAIAQFLSDIVKQKGQEFAYLVRDNLKEMYDTNYDYIAAGLEAITNEAYKSGRTLSETLRLGGARSVEFSDVGKRIIQGITSEIQRNAAGIESTVGGDLAGKYLQKTIKELFMLGVQKDSTPSNTQKEKMMEQQQALSQIIANLTGNADNTDFEETVRGFMTLYNTSVAQFNSPEKIYKLFIEKIKQDKYSLGVLGANYSDAKATIGQSQIDANTSQIMSEVLTGNSELFNLADALYAAEEAARKYNITTAELTDEQLAGLTEIEQSAYKARQSTADPKAQAKAAAKIVEEASKTSSYEDIRQQALVFMSNTAQSSDTRSLLAGLYSLASQMQTITTPGMSSAEQRNIVLARGADARSMGILTDPEARKVNEQSIQAEQQTYADALQQMRQFLVQERELNIQMSNAEADMHKQRRRQQKEFNLQREYAEKDYRKQRFRAERDFNIQMNEAQQDFDKQRERALQQHNLQISRMMEDAASQMYDPFQRIQAKDVFDVEGLTSNLMQQAKAIQDQIANVNALLQAGVSQQTIDQLGLGQAAHAKDAQKALEDIMSDPSKVNKLNSAAAFKAEQAGKQTTNKEMNQQFRRSEEDFAISLAQQDYDFNLSIDRAKTKFNTSMSDMSKDFASQMARSVKAFKLSMSQMLIDFETNRKRAYAQLARFGDDMAELASTDQLINQFAKAFERIPGLINNKSMEQIKIMMESYKTWVKDQVDAANQSLNASSVRAYLMANPAATVKQIREDLGTFMKSGAKDADIKALKSFILNSGNTQGDNIDQIANSALYKKVFLAEGGIVTRQTDAVIAEAGYPEAVVPLNYRGATMLAEVMGRYVNSTDVLTSRVQPYSSASTNNSSYMYDQKTQFNGPITVQSQNPDDMARRLAARARRTRLASPVGSR